MRAIVEPAHECVMIDVGPTIGAELRRRAQGTGWSEQQLARRVLAEWVSKTQASLTIASHFSLDPAKRIATISGRVVHLTPTETKVLATLLEQPGEPIAVDAMMLLVWGAEVPDRGVLAIHITRLREKLGPTARILMQRGLGYWIEIEDGEALDG